MAYIFSRDVNIDLELEPGRLSLSLRRNISDKHGAIAFNNTQGADDLDIYLLGVALGSKAN